MRKLSIIWPLVLIAAAGLWLFHVVNGLPTSWITLIKRLLPVVLIALGLVMLLGRRVRFGNVMALAITGLFTFGIAQVAYNRQTDVIRSDYTEPVDYIVEGQVTVLQVNIAVRNTIVEIRPAAVGDRSIRGQFVGSLESKVNTDFQVSGNIGTFTLQEVLRNEVPAIELIGRGKLVLTLPAGITLDQLTIVAAEGSLTVDTSTIPLKSVSLRTQKGDLAAIFSPDSGLIGDITAAQGNVTATIPSSLVAELTLRGNGSANPQYDDGLYTLNTNRVLVPRTGAVPQVQLTIDAAGTITIL